MRYILLFALLLGASAMLPFVSPSDPIAPARPVAEAEAAPEPEPDAPKMADAAAPADPAEEVAVVVTLLEAGPPLETAAPEVAQFPDHGGAPAISAAALSVLPDVSAAGMIPVGRILAFLGRGAPAAEEAPAESPASRLASAEAAGAPAAPDAVADILLEVALAPAPRTAKPAPAPETAPETVLAATAGDREALLPADTGVGFLTLDSRPADDTRLTAAAPDRSAPDAADALAADQPQAGTVMEVTAQFLNLRAGPSSGERALRGLPRGTRAEVLESHGDRWVRVRIQKSGRTGWVFARYLRPADA